MYGFVTKKKKKKKLKERPAAKPFLKCLHPCS